MIDFGPRRAILIEGQEENMLQNERHRKILSQLKLKEAVKVHELAGQLGISESTIRRDINELDQMGKLKKVFGGAVALGSDMIYGETDVAARTLINVEEKEKIARHAATLISDYDFVFLDAGTTTEKMIDYLKKKNVTYVTNGITHAKKLIQRGFEAHVIGGLLRPATEAVVGENAIDTIRRYNFTKCFMGATGIDLERGLTTRDISEAAVKTAAIRQSQRTFVLADHTKFGKVSSVSFAGLEEVCVITDRLDEPQYGEHAIIEIVE